MGLPGEADFLDSPSRQLRLRRHDRFAMNPPIFMKLLLALVFSAALAATGTAQDHSSPNPTGTLTPETVKVHKLDENLTAPELIPRDYSPVLVTDCQHPESVKEELKYIVDSAGNVHNIQAPEDADADMTLLLFQYMRTVHFKPAQWNGLPVAVGLADTISFHACYIEKTDEAGRAVHRVKLTTAPDHRFASWGHAPAEVTLFNVGPDGQEGIEHTGRGTGVTPPMPVHTADPQFSEYARRNKIQGTVVLQFIVDSNGLPQNVEVVKPIGYGLDQNAVESVRQYRFKPAMKNGRPVPAYLTVVVNFRLY